MTKELDISSEARRTYYYGNGGTFVIPDPERLFILIDDNGGVSHRVVSGNGETYRPERDWVGISWRPRDGQPAFVA
jgi:hypothetical protein